IYGELDQFDFVDANDVLTVKCGDAMLDRAKEHMFALLLNIVSGRIGNETVISADDRVTAEAVSYVASLISDDDETNDEFAKNICELINTGALIGSGVIPSSSVRYKLTGVQPLPGEFLLEQNYPNPFNPTTEIGFALPSAMRASLCVYNIAGQRVETLVSGFLEAGRHAAHWDASTLASGVYFYRLETEEFTASRKMVLMK
ncbi:MAG: T9SS type A sorting domain-containing protein, partial [bacterium]